MRTQKKWTIPLLSAIVCAAAIFLMQPGKVAAADQAETLDPMTIDYLDPFDLTVRQLLVSQSVSTSGAFESAQPTAVTTVSAPLVVSESSPTPSSPYVKPLKVWIPFRPTFRSPCTPSW